MSIDFRNSKSDDSDLYESQDSVFATKIVKKRSSMTKQKFLNMVIFIILIVAVALSAYFYYKLHNLEKSTQEGARKEAKDLLGKVAKLYLIPTGEEPTIATVSDPVKLKDQAFFSGAQKDDKVLIFTEAGKAVLYRPSIDKIIEVAPINNKKDVPPPVPEKTTGPLKDKTF
jgi:hypothetical protein